MSLAAAPSAVLVFTVEDHRFALPLSRVERVVRAVAVTPLPGAPRLVMGVINAHGTIVPVINMRKRLGLPEREIAVSDRFVLAQRAGRSIALAVDAIDGVSDMQLQAKVTAASELGGSDLVDGVLKLRGGIALVQDLDRFLSAAEEEQLSAALERRRGD